MSNTSNSPLAVLKFTSFEIRILLDLSYFEPKIIFESVLGNLKSPNPMSDSYLSSLFIATKFSYLAVTLNGTYCLHTFLTKYPVAELYIYGFAYTVPKKHENDVS